MTLPQLVRGFVRRHAVAYTGAGVMLAGIALLTVWIPRHVGHIVDGLVAHTLPASQLWQDIAWLAVAGVIIYGLRVGWRIRLYAAAYRMGVELRERLYARFLLHGPEFYHRRRTGDLMALATNDIDAIEQASGEALLAGFDGSLTLVLVVIAMSVGVDWRLACVALVPFPFMAFAFWRISRHVHDRSRDALETFGALNDHVQEALAGVRTLRSLGLEHRSGARFATLATAASDAAFEAQRWEARYEPAVGTTLSIAVVLSLALGGRLVWIGELTIGQLTSFGLYLGQLIWPMFAAGWVLALWERGRAAWTRLSAVLDEPLTISDSGRRAVVEPGPLVLDAVCLTYAGAPVQALRELSLAIPQGHTVALVGPTGAGKSTVLRLLLRQWAPQSGRVEWNGVDIGAYRLDALRGAIAWVPQEPVLFSATVAGNIALGHRGVTRGHIEEAARLAAVHEDILRLPDGYDTVVGERGVTLSGGQRQRVAIARALLAPSPLLLLDDALSAVDTETQRRILATLRTRDGSRTTIVVSHRLSAVADADTIVVLRNGRVVEQGTHAELLGPDAADGWYARQWAIQQLEATIDVD
ncbi:MAG: ATP-binding cassette domain-containing protein [Betaproteobacteria bacterium]|nr:ATP-binding cassette domain-containing protein [Betaproteobacteria bacterium]